jgi:prepilin peptidase CpaA
MNIASDPFYFALMALLVFAAGFDILKFQIPNWLVLICAGLFVITAIATPGPVNWLSHLAASALMLALSLAIFPFGIMGGGDLKLISALCLWTGLSGMLALLVAIAIAGGVLSLLLIISRWIAGRLSNSDENLPRALRSNGPVPYGVAIAAGTIYLIAAG